MTNGIEKGAVLRNGFNGETFIFSKPLNDAQVAAFDVLLEEGGSGGGNALIHVHPTTEETFVVRSGRIKVVTNGKEQVVEAGQSTTVPPGVPHFFVNAHPGATALTIEFRPAQQWISFFANFGRLAERRPQWFSAKGDPHLLLIALVFDSYRNHLYLAGLPIFLQKLLFGLLAPVARLRGYRLEVAPRPK